MSVGYIKNRQIFSSELDSVLVEYFSNSADIYSGLSPKEVKKLAVELAVANAIYFPESWSELLWVHEKTPSPFNKEA